MFGCQKTPEKIHSAPPATRLYAIGDIHGRADLLAALHGLILDDTAGAEALRKVVVYLGDYIDRGSSSREVIDMLLDAPLEGFESVHLLGNHEETMLKFLKDPSIGSRWFLNGGNATVMSYGVGGPEGDTPDERWRNLGKALVAAVPARHIAFLKSLKPDRIEGDYLFVHAGIRPGLPLDKQKPEDQLWIRDEFLKSKTDHGKCVVHGHTITTEIESRPNRIGIDTGAYYSGMLSCLVMEGDERRVIETKG